MRLSHLLLILVTAFSFSNQTVAAEKTRNLSGPQQFTQYTGPILGHWKTDDPECVRTCEFIIEHYTTYAAKMTTIGDDHTDTPIWLHRERENVWSADTKYRNKHFYIQYENGKLYNEYDIVWHRVD